MILTPRITITVPFSPLQLTDTQINVSTIRQQLADFSRWSLDQFKQEIAVEQLVFARSHYIDQLLQRLWQYYLFEPQTGFIFNRNRFALIAVGGYGRQELHPLSDIDLLILTDKPLPSEQQPKIEALIQLLWDLGLNVGHSVRTLKTCITDAKTDLTVMTNLMESRLIVGNQRLLGDLQQKIFAKTIWPSSLFYQAKVKEQQARHHQYQSTSYKLEPDIKNSPGGLRDIQTINWIAIRHFRRGSAQDSPQFQFLSNEEIEELRSCQRFLWRIRFALHSVVKRYDNRLLFDRQLTIAHLLGYQGQGNIPVENMMHDYYRVVHAVTELNQMLLQLFSESMLIKNHTQQFYAIDQHFIVRDGLIDINDNQLFIRDSSMIMQLFYTLLIQPKVRGIHSNTIRQLRHARRHLIGLLCEDAKSRAHFLAIIKHPDAIIKALLPMHQLGILAIYIPGWKHIVGLMQFDLFHTYTVDEHTMRVLLELHSFTTTEGQQRHPNSSRLFQQLSKPYLLIIAALFHDIGKGLNGDHSILGANALQQFCQLHDLPKQDSELVVWLVRHHLLMSVTAQGRDIQDPAVIQAFAQQVQSQQRLQFLLCLTVADVCATNETLWNSWKQSLLRALYIATDNALMSDLQQAPRPWKIVRQHKKQAKRLLTQYKITYEQAKQLWNRYSFDYFLRYSPEQIAWHTINLLDHDLQKPLVLIHPEPEHGGTELFIYSPDKPFLFASVSNQIGHFNLNIHDASIVTTKDHYALDTFIVLEPNGQSVSPDRQPALIQQLEKVLLQKTFKRQRIYRPNTKLRHFAVPTQVNFLAMQSNDKTHMQLITLDRPGLLAYVSEVFAELRLSLHSAKIVTIGEHVEDLFLLTDKEGYPLTDIMCIKLRQLLIEVIDSLDGGGS
jgi:[protein-PII] uridylyltransferase